MQKETSKMRKVEIDIDDLVTKKDYFIVAEGKEYHISLLGVKELPKSREQRETKEKREDIDDISLEELSAKSVFWADESSDKVSEKYKHLLRKI
jgi:hypothetical protein